MCSIAKIDIGGLKKYDELNRIESMYSLICFIILVHISILVTSSLECENISIHSI